MHAAAGDKLAVDRLFAVHTVFAAVAGALAVVVPHVWEFFFLHHAGETLQLFASTRNDDQKVTHLVIRLFGGLIVAQAFSVWAARSVADAPMRRALVRAYFVAFALMTLSLLRAQTTTGGGFNALNWLNIAGFGALAALYGWFAFVRPIAVFEGLGKAIS